jgi:hypothetical protein
MENQDIVPVIVDEKTNQFDRIVILAITLPTVKASCVNLIGVPERICISTMMMIRDKTIWLGRCF